MDIKQLYQSLRHEVVVMKDISTSSHLPPGFFSSFEEELLMSPAYESKKPDSYPTGAGEQFGLRSLKSPAEIIYKQHTFRIGTTVLHVKEKHSADNLHSLLLAYTGNAEELPLPGSPTGLAIATPTLTLLHENGTISTGIFIGTRFAIIHSWFPDGQPMTGGMPYAQHPEDFREILVQTLLRAGHIPVPQLEAMTDAYFLAKEVYEKQRVEIE